MHVSIYAGYSFSEIASQSRRLGYDSSIDCLSASQREEIRQLINDKLPVADLQQRLAIPFLKSSSVAHNVTNFPRQSVFERIHPKEGFPIPALDRARPNRMQDQAETPGEDGPCPIFDKSAFCFRC